MTASTLVDMVKINIMSIGAGPLTLGPAVAGFRGIEALSDGVTYSYSIRQNGNYEYGQGVFTASIGSFSRVPYASSNGGSPISLTANAVIAFPVLAEDLRAPFTTGVSAPRYPATGEYSGLNYDASTGALTDAGLREVWLDWFYVSDLSTDNDALQLFASMCNTAVFADVVLRFAAGKGRGPSGRYLISSEVQFTVSNRVVLDFGAATIRYTDATSKFRYSPPQVAGSSSITPPTFFVVRGGVHQYATAVDCLFWWDIPYISSRTMGTGYAENLRVIPQDNNNTAQTFNAVCRTSNAWYFSISGHFTAPPRNVGSIFAGCSLIEQHGLCVVVAIFDATECLYFDNIIEPGVSPMVGVEGTFGSGTYALGKALRQGGNIAYFGRNDSAYGFHYSLYGEVGTLTTGVCDLLDGSGTIVGSFTISSIGRYSQLSEGLAVGGGSTFINGNHFCAATTPADALGNKWLDWTFGACHMNMYQEALKLDGIASLQIGDQASWSNNAASTVLIDINHGDGINIVGMFATTNALSGCTAIKLRNITGGQCSKNTLYFYATTIDTDNTVKDFDVEGNTCYLGTGVIVNTGNRYNATNTRGIRFRNNGSMGAGIDLDDNRKLAWTPVVTSESGSITAYTIVNAVYNINNGVITFRCKITVTNRGTASGQMIVTGPKLPDVSGPINLGADATALGQIANVAVPVNYDSGTGKFQLHGPTDNTTDNAFAFNDVSGNFVYYISGSWPIEYN